jgi:hypothetical protein
VATTIVGGSAAGGVAAARGMIDVVKRGSGPVIEDGGLEPGGVTRWGEYSAAAFCGDGTMWFAVGRAAQSPETPKPFAWSSWISAQKLD